MISKLNIKIIIIYKLFCFLWVFFYRAIVEGIIIVFKVGYLLGMKGIFYLTPHNNTFYLWLYGVGHELRVVYIMARNIGAPDPRGLYPRLPIGLRSISIIGTVSYLLLFLYNDIS